MNCKRCGTQNDRESIYCKQCGHRLKAAKRGFASMSQAKREAIAKAGGIAAHKKGTAHTYSHDEAIAAGKKGGKGRKREQ